MSHSGCLVPFNDIIGSHTKFKWDLASFVLWIQFNFLWASSLHGKLTLVADWPPGKSWRCSVPPCCLHCHLSCYRSRPVRLSWWGRLAVRRLPLPHRQCLSHGSPLGWAWYLPAQKGRGCFDHCAWCPVAAGQSGSGRPPKCANSTCTTHLERPWKLLRKSSSPSWILSRLYERETLRQPLPQVDVCGCTCSDVWMYITTSGKYGRYGCSSGMCRLSSGEWSNGRFQHHASIWQGRRLLFLLLRHQLVHRSHQHFFPLETNAC